MDPQLRPGRLWKISPLPGFDPRTAQPLESLLFGLILAPLRVSHQDNVYQETLPPHLCINFALSPTPLTTYSDHPGCLYFFLSYFLSFLL